MNLLSNEPGASAPDVKSFESPSKSGGVLPYRFLEKVAIADVAFEAEGGTLDNLFESCANALTEVMVDRRDLKPRVKVKIELAAESTDNLLYDFLTELIVKKDVDSILFKEFKLSLDEAGKSLAGLARGEPIDRKRHRLRNDVKAVTTHLFGIKKSARGWSTTVVLDI